MSLLFVLWRAFIWPGAGICRLMGINPAGEMGLLRSMFTMLVWIPIGLLIVLILT